VWPALQSALTAVMTGRGKLTLCLCLLLLVAAAPCEAAISYDLEAPYRLWTSHALQGTSLLRRHGALRVSDSSTAMLQVMLSLDYWFIMIIHVLLCITFWCAFTGARSRGRCFSGRRDAAPARLRAY